MRAGQRLQRANITPFRRSDSLPLHDAGRLQDAMNKSDPIAPRSAAMESSAWWSRLSQT